MTLYNKIEAGKRLTEIITDSGLNSGEFAESIKGDPSYLSKMENGKKGISSTYIEEIESVYNVNRQWLLFGTGEKYGPKGPEREGVGTKYMKRRLALKNRNADITIPFYDIEAIGGKEHGADMTAITQPTGTVDIGDFLRDSKAALRVYGNSMIPNYPPGCVVGLIEKPDRYIHPGHVYVIETGNDRYVKRLYYSDDQTKYVCVSDNTQMYEQGPMKGKYFYPLFEIPMDAVSRIYDVTGVIKRNINTIVLNR